MLKFEKFNYHDTKRYLEYLNECKEICGFFSPYYQLVYKRALRARRAYYEGLCWTKSESEKKYLAPIGNWDNCDFASLFKECFPNGAEFEFVPEYLLELWKEQLGNMIIVNEPDKDDFEYIVSARKLIERENRNFRRNCKFFEQNYDFIAKDIKPEDLRDIKNFQKKAWKELKMRTAKPELIKEEKSEFRYIEKLWEKQGNLWGNIIRIDGNVVSVIIGETVSKDISNALYTKNDYSFKGLGAYMHWYHAKSCNERGIKYINFFEDLGIESLRTFKEKLHPVKLLKTFSVTYRTDNYT